MNTDFQEKIKKMITSDMILENQVSLPLIILDLCEMAYKEGKNEAIEKARKGAYINGNIDGRLEGYENGYKDGRHVGYEDGYNEGKENGYELGYKDGRYDATKRLF